ncbi:MAG: class I SAM-dependent methyltransferase [Flavobacteriaceae bacterium]
MNNKQAHWENIYTYKSPQEVSWTQKKPALSLSWIQSLHLPKDAPIIDVGGGESLLVDHLIDMGYSDLTILDISQAALNKSQERLGSKAKLVQWIQADITTFQPKRNYTLWHDRAVFHFLTQKDDIATYTKMVSTAVDQYLLMSTFSKEGPLKCSGLPITQYDAESILANFSATFELIQQDLEVHTTPFDTTQAFIYALFKKTDK